MVALFVSGCASSSPTDLATNAGETWVKRRATEFIAGYDEMPQRRGPADELSKNRVGLRAPLGKNSSLIFFLVVPTDLSAKERSYSSALMETDVRGIQFMYRW